MKILVLKQEEVLYLHFLLAETGREASDSLAKFVLLLGVLEMTTQCLHTSPNVIT